MKKTKRCFEFNKKLGLFHFDCKCENIFCPKCRHPENHNCTFDFKNDGRIKLEEQMEKSNCKEN